MCLMNIPKLLNTLKENENIITKQIDNIHIAYYNKTNFQEECRQLRSVIYDTTRILSISPPKSMNYDIFQNTYPFTSSDIIVEDFIEGTMINLFWHNDQWSISTKTTIGGNCSFFGVKKFKTMFDEASLVMNLDMTLLNKNQCYSFVLQHPENRIVTQFHKPILWLIEAYHIDVDENQIQVLSTRDIIKYDCAFTNTKIRVPEIYYQFSSYKEVFEYIATKPYYMMGIVIRNTSTNERTKIRNMNYEYVRQLRGNQPKIQFHFFVLLKQGRTNDFLTFYPEYKPQFKQFHQEYTKYIYNLFLYYKSCYILKEYELKQYPVNYKTHMYKIHEIYKNVLKPNGSFVKYADVNQYFIQLDAQLQLWSINFDKYS